MRPVEVHAVISAPREEIFDFVGDLANRPAYAGHYMRDYHLARAKSDGPGAAARFRVRAPLAAQWVEIVVAEFDRPRRIVEEARVGRLGRTRAGAVYELVREGPELTRVELISWTEPATAIDRLRESLGARAWLRRSQRRALERLREIFEEGVEGPLPRATIAGYEPLRAPRFGARVRRPGSQTAPRA